MADAKEMENIDEKSKLNTENEGAKIKFQPSKNGEAKIEMPESGSAASGYQCGLTKEELMKYAADPFWVALRRILFILFWVLWVGMLVGAVAIIIVTPKCAAPKEPEWFESSPFYELGVDTFSDSDGDQKADLKGISEKLPYLDEISVSALVLDQLFDPKNERIISPERGSFEDFIALAAKKKTILRIPLSEVDLTSEQRQADFVQTLRFWLEKGAAGFIFDEIELLGDPVGEISKLAPDWNRAIRNFSTEDFPRLSVLSSYGASLPDELCVHANMILDYRLINDLSKGFTAEQLLGALAHTAGNQTSPCRSNFVLSNGDVQPLFNRFAPAERDRLVIFTLLADATPFFYSGDEYAKDDAGLPDSLTRKHEKAQRQMEWKTVEDLKSDKGNNFFRVFARAAKLRKSEYAIRMGETALKLMSASSDVVAMSRVKKGNPAFAAVTNFGQEAHVVDLTELGSHIPETGHIDMVSSNSDKAKQKVQLKTFEISAQETIVVQFVPILS